MDTIKLKEIYMSEIKLKDDKYKGPRNGSRYKIHIIREDNQTYKWLMFIWPAKSPTAKSPKNYISAYECYRRALKFGKSLSTDFDIVGYEPRTNRPCC